MPQEAVIRDPAGRPQIVVIGKTRPVRRRTVELGPITDGQYIVTSGLATGETVVVLGQDRVENGQPLETSPFSPPRQRQKAKERTYHAAEFFINRPVFAGVIAILIVIAGVISIPQLPVSRFPVIAPPSVSIYATYTGAAPKTINDSVTSLIERELSSAKNILYFDSSADSPGSAKITVTFKPGTNPRACPGGCPGTG